MCAHTPLCPRKNPPQAPIGEEGKGGGGGVSLVIPTANVGTDSHQVCYVCLLHFAQKTSKQGQNAHITGCINQTHTQRQCPQYTVPCHIE